MAETERRALIIDSGGRGHAFRASLGEDTKVFVAPGNAGTELTPNTWNVSLKDPVGFAIAEDVGLAIIGPEDQLKLGLADDFRSAGINVVGPSKEAAQLETSKDFATKFMEKYNIPYPRSWTISSLDDFYALIEKEGLAAQELVIKADGLAAGKGVTLPESDLEATATIEALLAGKYNGAGKEKIVIQERLSGIELSAFVLTDGENMTMLPFAQDYKRLDNGDQGVNTGGMGAVSPLPDTLVGAEQEVKIYDIARRTLDGMAREGTPYKGILYLGLMLANERGGDPVVIEYNARSGDPETQVEFPLLARRGDVFDLLRSTDTKLDTSGIDLGRAMGAVSLTVTIATEGYPENPQLGDIVYGLDGINDENTFVYHGGTKLDDEGNIRTSGGRALYATGIGNSFDEARAAAYAAIGSDGGQGADGVDFRGKHWRDDIGHSSYGEK